VGVNGSNNRGSDGVASGLILSVVGSSIVCDEFECGCENLVLHSAMPYNL